ncbi:MAG: cob(I)yrinic acid a,c-diamide adenosyltransferase [Promethearchaeota archaeon]
MREETTFTGKVHYHYGMGARKTTAMFGVLVRALGHGLRPYVVQFLKKTSGNGSGFDYGEVRTIAGILGVPVEQFGKPTFILPGDPPDPGDRVRSLLGLERAREVLAGGEYDLVLLDEIVDAVMLRHFEVGDVVEVVRSRGPRVEVMLSGHAYYPEIAEVSDYVTEFREVKHPYQQGVLARRGIEY